MVCTIQPVCPVCAGALEDKGDSCVCRRCRRAFRVDEGIPLLLPGELDEFKSRERDYHDSRSGDFDCSHSLDSPRVAVCKEEYLELLSSLPRGSSILELGCGTGWDARRLLARGMKVYLSDLAPAMVRVAREKIAETGGHALLERARFFVFDAERIPFPSGSFDAVCITAAFHHLAAPQQCLGEMARVCRAGGFVILGFEPNAWPYFTFFPLKRAVDIMIKAARLFIRSPAAVAGRVRSLRPARGTLFERNDGEQELFSPADRHTGGFTRRALRRMATAAGLEVYRISPVWYCNGFIQECGWFLPLRNPSSRLSRLLGGIDRACAKIPLLRACNWHWNVILRKPGESV